MLFTFGHSVRGGTRKRSVKEGILLEVIMEEAVGVMESWNVGMLGLMDSWICRMGGRGDCCRRRVYESMAVGA